MRGDVVATRLEEKHEESKNLLQVEKELASEVTAESRCLLYAAKRNRLFPTGEEGKATWGRRIVFTTPLPKGGTSR